MKKKSKGNIMDMITICVTILAMSIVVMAYLHSSELIMKKLEVSQISRKYILKMETEGYLSQPEKSNLILELHEAGLQGIDITGTTISPVTYGDTIYLKIKGTVKVGTINEAEQIWNKGFQKNKIFLEEVRMSTAKN